MERAKSANPVLDALLQAAFALHPTEIDLSLERLLRLLGRLGNPHLKLPPVFHVAGTNGKGSTCAYLRACLEASGARVHVYTSPHLIRFNERIRVAGSIIDDEALAALLGEALGRNAGQPITFFELTTAVAFLAFARTPADAAIIEVGMGGRMDATNVFEAPLVTGIAQLGLDHQAWLGPTILDIAREKAGIAKRGVPMVISRYPKAVTARIAEVAGVAGAPLQIRGQDWDAATYEGALHYRDPDGHLALPLPRLAGGHQADNAALAIAMLRTQARRPGGLAIPDGALRAGLGWAEWPARLQKLDAGPLTALLPPGSELWIDGGHNPAAARAIADAFRTAALGERPLHLIVGMLAAKDAGGFLKAFAGRATSVLGVEVDGHDSHPPEAVAAAARDAGLPAQTSAGVGEALTVIARAADRAKPPVVLVTGSLHLAGAVLAANGQSAG
ncbi:bifunctional folylpolyglutamate synthase/dihydrofolate synthase [alpha proteobacterium AAP81b]|nr:bifunctional folylpolyglutamate synthase/dihydrofolate synthase [alpha proteobacterium AAP81b]